MLLYCTLHMPGWCLGATAPATAINGTIKKALTTIKRCGGLELSEVDAAAAATAAVSVCKRLKVDKNRLYLYLLWYFLPSYRF